jgi:cytochrome c biogenesis factor
VKSTGEPFFVILFSQLLLLLLLVVVVVVVGEITAKHYCLQLASACDDACMSLVITAF